MIIDGSDYIKNHNDQNLIICPACDYAGMEFSMQNQILKILQTILEEKSILFTIDSSVEEIMDSMTFIKFVVKLEEEFHFEFDDNMLLITAFPIVQSMVEYVETTVSSLSDKYK